jgi:hypothetical protein
LITYEQVAMTMNNGPRNGCDANDTGDFPSKQRPGSLPAFVVYMPSGPRDIAASPVRTTSISPSGIISAMKLSIFDGLPVTSKTKLSVGGVDDLGAERIGQPQRLGARLTRAAHLDQRQLALERLALAGEVMHPMHRDQPLELQLDLGQHLGRCHGHHGDPAETLLVLGF